MDIYENKFLDATDLDTFNVLCSFAIFISNIICVVYIVWRAIPVIKYTSSIDRCFKLLEFTKKSVDIKSSEPIIDSQRLSLEKSVEKQPQKAQLKESQLKRRATSPVLSPRGSKVLKKVDVFKEAQK